MGFTDGAHKCFYIPPEKRLKACRDIELDSNPLQDAIVADPNRFVIFRAAVRVGKSFTAAKRHFGMSLAPKCRLPLTSSEVKKTP